MKIGDTAPQTVPADSNSSFNLANMDFKEAWEENFFDLRVFGAGYCYTYNPRRFRDKI